MYLLTSAAEFAADYGCGNRYVERFRCLASCRVVGDEEFLGYVLAAFLAYSVSFVAHNYQSVWLEFFLVDIITVKECSVYRTLLLY